MAIIEVINNLPVEINESCTIIIRNCEANLNYNLAEDSNILVYCDFDESLVLNENGKVYGCDSTINYIHLDNQELNHICKIDVFRNGNLNVNSTYLGTSNKYVKFDLYNRESNSSVNITNNVVALDDSVFTLDCIGTIVNGAKSSKCHQKNRCLTMGNPKTAKVLPVLNIDENDVEASHSLSSGTIDEEVLFYMNSRGLNKNQALNLIIKSYLMPSDDFYSHFDKGSDIQTSAVGKVDNLC